MFTTSSKTKVYVLRYLSFKGAGNQFKKRWSIITLVNYVSRDGLRYNIHWSTRFCGLKSSYVCSRSRRRYLCVVFRRKVAKYNLAICWELSKSSLSVKRTRVFFNSKETTSREP